MTPLTNTSSVGSVIVWQDLHGQQGSCQDENDGKAAPSVRRDPLTASLQKQGYQVKAIREEPKVLQAVLAEDPDLLMIDLQTAGERGYEFCSVLQRLPRTSSVLVVFIGTRSQDLELIKVLRCGGIEYIQLPISEEECWLKMKRHLKAVQLLRHLQAEQTTLQQKIWSYNHMLKQQEEEQITLAQENQALHRLAFTDGLTQVANRRRFNEMLPQLWQEAKDNEQPLSLLMCDIDYFKRYNDTYGHLAGDTCLQVVANALVQGAGRQQNQVARYGGEEFAILLPGTDTKEARKVALAVQAELACARVPHEASLVKPFVSVSIGVCTLEPALEMQLDSQNCHEVLIHGADEALYTAKLKGRDRIFVNSADGLIRLAPPRFSYNDRAAVNRCTPQKNRC